MVEADDPRVVPPRPPPCGRPGSSGILALDGEEVVIARRWTVGNRPLIRLEVLPGAREARELGTARGLILRMDDDFDAPLEDFAEYV